MEIACTTAMEGSVTVAGKVIATRIRRTRRFLVLKNGLRREQLQRPGAGHVADVKEDISSNSTMPGNAFGPILSSEIRQKNSGGGSRYFDQPQVIELEPPEPTRHSLGSSSFDSRRSDYASQSRDRSPMDRMGSLGRNPDRPDRRSSADAATARWRRDMAQSDCYVNAYDLQRAERSMREQSPVASWGRGPHLTSVNSSSANSISNMNPYSYASILRQPYMGSSEVSEVSSRRGPRSGTSVTFRREDIEIDDVRKPTLHHPISVEIAERYNQRASGSHLERTRSPEIKELGSHDMSISPRRPQQTERMPGTERETHEAFPWMVKERTPPATHVNRTFLEKQQYSTPTSAKIYPTDGRPEYKPTPISELKHKRSRLASDDDVVVLNEPRNDRSSPSFNASNRLSSPYESRIRSSSHHDYRSDRPEYREHIPRRSGSSGRDDQRNERPILRAAASNADDRVSSSSSEVACKFKNLGCPIQMNVSLVRKHENKCLYNPANGKEKCDTCGLAIPENHDCIDALKRELLECRLNDIRTRFNSTLVSRPSIIEQATVKVVERDQTEVSERVDLRVGDTTEDVIRLIIARLNARDSALSEYRIHRQWLDYQLVFQGMTKLQTNRPLTDPLYLPSEPHYLLLPRVMDIGLKVTKMYYDEDPVVVSYKDDILMQLDPTERVIKLKEYILEKLPIRWSRHDLYFRNKKLQDEQILFHAGIFHGDIVEIMAMPRRDLI